MLQQPITILKHKFPSLQNDTFIKFSIKSVITAQNFIRDNTFSSSVSLREVRRYVILFEWFILFLNDNQDLFKEKLEEYKVSIENCSVLLSIYICYFIRITDKKLRKEFSELKISNINFLELIKKIQRKVIDNFTIEKGIAKNRILLENLFALFVCVNNKIPIIICGKPGCSKSLSIKLIDIAMKGEKSSNSFFKKLPSIKITPYQGSITSTSQGVLEAFNIARTKIKDNNEKLISILYFDEMGLAEISPNNPLKVMHSQLEYDENKEKVAFVGISNWTLDASKMNRGIYLSIPVPDEQDLIETAIKIAESYSNSLNVNYEKEISELAQSYYEYKEYLSKQEEKKKIFMD